MTKAKSRRRRKTSGNNSRLGWKCIPSGKPGDTGSSGAICVPPRRRRLYVTPLTKWAETVAQPQESGGNTESSDKLREAFIQSAAVETFFLWHKFKKEKEREEKEKKEANGELPGFSSSVDGGEQNPQTLLQNGTIPPDFLRLMFYTLGDYRDICVGKTPDGIDTVSGKDTMENIKKAIESVFKPSSGTPSLSVEKTTRESWWEKNGEHIWKGMICALTYKENGADGTNKIEKDSDVYKKIFGENNTDPDKKLTVTTVDNKGTFESKYKYEKVQLGEEEASGPNAPASPTSPQANGTRLAEFVTRPAYFRYLEEWGETFCKERKKRLEKIKQKCKVEEDEYKCSGFGEDCQTNLKNDPSTIPSLECPDCAKHCSSYRKWIGRKKYEFTEQQNAFTKQKTDAHNNNGFCGKEGKCNTAADFLERLKNGPCKNNENRTNDINFGDVNGETFKHAENCNPCSEFKINCENGNCGGGTKVTCPGGKITAQNMKDMEKNTEINMLVSDDSTNGVEGDLKDCENEGIFEGIRKDEWICGTVCGYNVCKPAKVNGQKDGEKHIITIRALVTHWVHNFLEDYNRIKHRISHCMEKGEPSNCINGCNKKCNCVKKWISTKKQEWQQIKKQYLEQYKNQGESYPTKTVLEEFKERPVLNKAIKPCGGLEKFQNSTDCTVAGSSESGKDGTQKDIVECLLHKLETKAKNCPGKPSAEEQKPCDVSNPLVEDDDEHFLEEEDQNPEENTVGKQQPSFCPPVEDKKKEEEEETCTPASPVPEKPVPQVPCWRPFKPPNMFPKRIKKKNACEIAEEILKDNDGKKQVGQCHPKNNDKNYLQWNCDENKIKTTEVGACMPPRRQKLCLYYLTQLNYNDNADKLREAFIKSAAAETFLSWHYFKTKNGDNAQTQLKAGKIPAEFLRSMFNTYGDYRDLFLEKDISSEVHTIKDNINKVFRNSVRRRGETSDTKRQKWWNEHGPEIWKGMLCALSYDTEEKNVNTQIRQRLTKYYDYKNVAFTYKSGTPLEKFASRPQFLRWFTEWGEDFCTQRKKQFEILQGKCVECTVSDSGTSDKTKTCDDKKNCDTCKTACTTYQNWLQKWKTDYAKQRNKYAEDKKKDLYKSIDDVKNSPNAFEYLYKQLKHFICENGDCNCMENSSKQQKQSSTDGDKMPESLDEKPEKVKDKCNCVLHECSGLSVTDSGIPDGSAFGGGLPPGKCKGLEGGPQKKIEPPTSDYINDILKSTIPVGIALALGSIAFLFMKKKKKKRL
ncbi:hypothetical protein PFFVO_00001 [Plasmodium falciparum Vietnam Oak-Knoll (FVO)]|uniref:Duffy-binding-like domain-containing protein n=1 Tax=Plasmodium falciparum Vietnam Oak-Knoll (FVO) TaxID=1036723 RepID=A0A024VFL7_PLAFA|nr:hypothetical protein PFFVO_00001 [Plasmodium falciparum Vietnam Oak-Knoll (FVO)]